MSFIIAFMTVASPIISSKVAIIFSAIFIITSLSKYIIPRNALFVNTFFLKKIKKVAESCGKLLVVAVRMCYNGIIEI